MEVYGFGINYPTGCQVEFNPKSKRDGGDIALKSSDGYKIFVSWGPMKKIERSFKDTSAHADYSVKRIAERGEAKVNFARREFRRVNGHEATLTQIKLDFVKRGLFFKTARSPQEVRSLHVHCVDSSRYFVIYGSGKPEQSAQQGVVVAEMVRSFKCH